MKIIKNSEKEIVIENDKGEEIKLEFNKQKELKEYTKEDLKILDNQISHATQMMCMEYPYHGFITMSLIKEFNTVITRTMAICQKDMHYNMLISPSFWESLMPKWRIGLILHEVSHIAFFHTTIDNRMYEDMSLLGIAKDLVVNQYIKRELLPDEGCFLESFPELKLEKDRDVNYYYLQLKKDQDNNGKSSILRAMKDMNKALEQLDRNGEGGTLSGPGFKIELTEHNKHDIDQNTGEELNDIQRELLETQLLSVLNNAASAAKQAGKMPGCFEEILNKKNIKPKPKWNYHKFLRRFAGNSSETCAINTRMRPNFLIEENPGIRSQGLPSILIGLDISRSMSTKLLESLQNDMFWMIRQDYDVTIAQFDTEIHKVEKYKKGMELKLLGRGGTDFNAICKYFVEHQKDYSCLIVLSDGCASVPDQEILTPSSKVLWCFTEHNKEEFPGLKVYIDEELNNIE